MPSHRSRSVYSDDMDAYSTDSQWTTTYRSLPKKQPKSIWFMSWAAGCPRGANVVKKKTRDSDGRSTRSGSSSVSYWGSDPDTQLYWTYSSSSSSGRSSSGRSSRSGRKGGSRGKHFEGALPPMHLPPHGPGFGAPMGDFGGHPPPPPPPMMNMGGHPGGGFPPPPPPPAGPPMGGGGGDPGFIDLTGQQHQGFQGMAPQGGHHHMGASADSYYTSDESSDSEWSHQG